MTSRSQRSRVDADDADRGQRPSQAPAPTVPEQVLALQRSAGNAAVARAVLARDTPNYLMDPAARPAGIPGIGLGPGLGLGAYQPKEVPASVEAKVRDYLQARKVAIGTQVQAGATSMPEVIAAIRRDVPESLAVEAWQLQPVINEVMGRETPPQTRARPSSAGTAAELEASIANAFPKPPTSVKLSNRAGSLELSVSGIEIRTKVAGVGVTAKADKESGSVTASKGDVSVTAQASFKGDSVGLKTKVGDVSFDAKLEKENGTWSKWSMDLSIPLVGEATEPQVPTAELKEAVDRAHAAVGRIVSHLAAGGSPTDDVVKKAMEDVKPAIEGVSKARQAPKGPSVTIGVKGTGGSSGISGSATLTITF